VVSWLECLPDSTDGRCALAPEPLEFVVRLQAARSDRASHACGVSLRPGNGALGHFITIFSDCIEEGADRLLVDDAVVFAYTLVHEIGHLLLPAGHAPAGIMRARPDALDWQRAAEGSLGFTPREVRLLRAAVRARAQLMTHAR